MKFAAKTFRRSLTLKQKNCKECGKLFEGIYNAKYCPNCRTSSVYVKNHKKQKKLEINEFENVNRKIKYSECCCKEVEMPCLCCGQPFNVKLIPRVHTYPKYCEKHRNPWKRELHLRNTN